jgi:hypothetical protein
MADGGNNELGDVKENKVLKLPLLDVTDIRSCSSSCDVPSIMYRSNVTARRLVASESSRRSGRMLAKAAGGGDGGGGGRGGKGEKQQIVLDI